MKKEIDRILSLYNYEGKVYFRGTKSKQGVSGYCDSSGDYIVISSDLKSRKDIIGTLFHELGHIHCIKNKLFWQYHKTVTNEFEAKQRIKWAIRAEQYVDKWAEREMFKYDKRIKWEPTYFSKEDIDWWKKEWAPNILKEWRQNYLGKKFYSNIH